MSDNVEPPLRPWVKISLSAAGFLIAFFGGAWINNVNTSIQAINQRVLDINNAQIREEERLISHEKVHTVNQQSVVRMQAQIDKLVQVLTEHMNQSHGKKILFESDARGPR